MYVCMYVCMYWDFNLRYTVVHPGGVKLLGGGICNPDFGQNGRYGFRDFVGICVYNTRRPVNRFAIIAAKSKGIHRCTYFAGLTLSSTFFLRFVLLVGRGFLLLFMRVFMLLSVAMLLLIVLHRF